MAGRTHGIGRVGYDPWMGKRDKLQLLLGATLGVWLVREILGWLFGLTLDSLWIDSGYYASVVAWGHTMLTANQDVLLGVGIGLGIALAVIYWPLVKVKARRSLKWTALFFRAAWRSRPGYRRLTWGGGVKLLSGVRTKTFDTVPFDMSNAQIRNQSNPAAVHLEIIASGRLRASRQNDDEVQVLIARYELWGRPLFWATIKKAWKSDIVGLIEWMDEKAEADRTAS